MKDILFIADSGCGIPDEYIKKYNVRIVGLKIYLDGKEYSDGVEFKDKFYDMMRKARSIPTTSQVLLNDFMDIFESAKKAGYKHILYMALSSKTSGTYQTALTAASQVKGIEINVVDTYHVSIGAGLIAIRMMELIEDEGKSVNEVLSVFKKIYDNVYMQFIVDTLEYLHKNGRIGKAASILGSLLNIKPILGVEDGEIAVMSKVRGEKRVMPQMINRMQMFFEGRNKKRLAFVWAADEMKKKMEKLMDLAYQSLKGENIEFITMRVWPTIAVHSGPQVYGMIAYGEKESLL